MAVEDKHISNRIYLVAIVILLMAMAIAVKLTNIQWVDGNHYRELAKERTVKNFVIPANKGNIYSADGSLLATSIPNYVIRFDALAPKSEVFEKNIKLLSDSLGKMLRRSSSTIQNELRNIQKSIDLYNCGQCPTCQTPFDGEHFVSLLETLIEKKKSSEAIKLEIETNVAALREKQKKLQSISDETTKAFNDITWLLKSYKQQIDKLQLKANSNQKIKNEYCSS